MAADPSSQQSGIAGPQEREPGPLQAGGRVLFILRMPWALALNQRTPGQTPGGQLPCPKGQGHQRSIPVCDQELWAWVKTAVILCPYQQGPEVCVLNIRGEAGPSQASLCLYTSKTGSSLLHQDAHMPTSF